MKNYYSSYKEEPQMEYFKFNMNFFKNIAIGFFGYVNHFALHPVFKPIQKSSKLGFYSMIIRSSYLPMLLYNFIAVCGAISFGKDTPNFIILRPPIEGSSDIFMLIGQFGVFVVIAFGIIVRVRCMTEITLKILNENNFINLNEEGEPKFYIKALTLFCFSGTTLLLSFLVGENVLSIISLFSSITCTYYIVICPSK